MHPEFRAAYNAAYSDDLYRRSSQELSRRLGRAPDFRLAETPVFLPAALCAKLVESAHAILAQISRPETIAQAWPRLCHQTRAEPSRTWKRRISAP